MNSEDLDVSRETFDRLQHFETLVRKWNSTINLVAKNDLVDLWGRHIVDSMQVTRFLSTSPKKWIDIGSGGGFPGVVVAVLAKEISPETKTILIESDVRKATFLRTVVRELDLDCAVLARRIENVEPQDARILSARALAPLEDLFRYGYQHLSQDGRTVFLKGQNFQKEIDLARKKWKFDVVAHPSLTDKRARIIEAWNLEPIS